VHRVQTQPTGGGGAGALARRVTHRVPTCQRENQRLIVSTRPSPRLPRRIIALHRRQPCSGASSRRFGASIGVNVRHTFTPAAPSRPFAPFLSCFTFVSRPPPAIKASPPVVAGSQNPPTVAKIHHCLITTHAMLPHGGSANHHHHLRRSQHHKRTRKMKGGC
jgi:hypothetical protein